MNDKRHCRRLIAFARLNLCRCRPVGANCMLLHFEVCHLSVHIKGFSSLLGAFLGFRQQLR